MTMVPVIFGLVGSAVLGWAMLRNLVLRKIFMKQLPAMTPILLRVSTLLGKTWDVVTATSHPDAL